MIHKLYDLARMFGPVVGNVGAHLNAADIGPLEFDKHGNHSYGDDAREHLAKLAGQTDETSTATAAEVGDGDYRAHVSSEEVHIDASGPTNFART